MSLILEYTFTLLFIVTVKVLHICAATCSHEVFTQDQSIITSPNFPMPYDDDTSCTYLIRAPQGKIVRLSFLYIDIERAFGCVYDALQVFDGDSEDGLLLAWVCGSDVTHTPIYSSNRKMFLKFDTDSMTSNSAGFQLQADFLTDGPDFTACDDITITTDGTVLTSPDYPGSYGANLDCVYNVIAPQGMIVALNFSHFSVEYHTSCFFDRLLVYDGATTSHPQLLRICGTGIPNKIYSTTNLLTVRFQSDDTYTDAGFRAYVSFIAESDAAANENDDFLLCDYTPCFNGGTCTDLSDGGYECECPDQVFGNNCEHDLRLDCTPNPCENGGSCFNLNVNICVCQVGYTGRLCEFTSSETSNECTTFTNPCLNGGQCTAVWDQYFCSCPSEYRGPVCEYEVGSTNNPCLNVYCTNSGLCLVIGGEPTCLCHEDDQGITCEIDNNLPCASNPCENGGQCHYYNDGYSYDGWYCVCLQGYSGFTCSEEIFNPCSGSNFLCLYGSCAVSNNVAICTCYYGWKGDNCDEYDYCLSQPCQNGGSCGNLISGFVCDCPEGYGGSTCSSETNPCAASNNPCVYGSCQAFINGTTYCICNGGWTGDNCNEIDYCFTSPCENNGVCSNNADNGFTCSCLDGYTGSTCSIVVNQACVSNPCQNFGSCLELSGGGYYCNCIPEFSGPTCSDATESCNSNPCENFGTCIERSDGSGGYYCNCPPEFTGETCSFVMIANDQCQNGGTSLGTSGDSFICRCLPEYSGLRCEDESSNPCFVSPCKNGGECLYIAAAVICVCGSDFDGEYCEIDLNDPCSSNPCQNFAICLLNGADTTSFLCECQQGYSGTYCEIDEDHPCAHNPCQNRGTCLINGANFFCACSVGFEGGFCEEDTSSPCYTDPCLNGGTCHELASNFYCVCLAEFTGIVCDQYVCVLNPCQNGGSCNPNNGVAVCSCETGWDGDLCHEDIDECQSSPCQNGNCLNNEGSFTCDCNTGYTGELCQDVTNVGSGSAQSSPLTEIGVIAGIAVLGGFLLVVMIVGFTCLMHKFSRNSPIPGGNASAGAIANPSYAEDPIQPPTGATASKSRSPTYHTYIHSNNYDQSSAPSSFAPPPPSIPIPPSPPPEYTYIDNIRPSSAEDDYMYLDPMQ
ncbi:uncharacterized protein [Apostichopus japonicus]|uniref:uncharacterized protein isoform X2 n=1 Tax=Stichopus japonicus TaxID=307972 RepID=UPI003AB41D5E